MTEKAKKILKKPTNKSGRWRGMAASKTAKSTTVHSTRRSDSMVDTADHDWKLIGLAAVGGVLGLIAAMW